MAGKLHKCFVDYINFTLLYIDYLSIFWSTYSLNQSSNVGDDTSKVLHPKPSTEFAESATFTVKCVKSESTQCAVKFSLSVFYHHTRFCNIITCNVIDVWCAFTAINIIIELIWTHLYTSQSCIMFHNIIFVFCLVRTMDLLDFF